MQLCVKGIYFGGSVEEYGGPFQKVDAVLWSNCLYGLQDSADHTLSRVYDWLNPGGVIVVVTAVDGLRKIIGYFKYHIRKYFSKLFCIKITKDDMFYCKQVLLQKFLIQLCKSMYSTIGADSSVKNLSEIFSKRLTTLLDIFPVSNFKIIA